MGFAKAAAVRGTCDRKQVGAVVVSDQRVVATGYNGSIVHSPHCDEAGHDMANGRCVRTVHAEMNAIAQAAKFGVPVDGSTIYTTAGPCWDCFRVSVNAGIVRFVFAEEFGTSDKALAAEMAKRISEVVDNPRLQLTLLHLKELA